MADPRETDQRSASGPPSRRGSVSLRTRRRAGVAALALLGLALTAGITLAASSLVSQPIGLTSEPATLGDSLAPASQQVVEAPATTGTARTVTRTVTVPARTTTTTTTSAPAATPAPATSTREDEDRRDDEDRSGRRGGDDREDDDD